jgi:hypothetical protein
MGYGFAYFNTLAAGKYKILFTPSWGSKDVRDYTIKVYSPEKLNVYDSAGKTSFEDSAAPSGPVVVPTPTPTPTPEPEPEEEEPT